ncbi:MAG: primosomal protein N', partial [Steroidobacteraceae bacterium]
MGPILRIALDMPLRRLFDFLMPSRVDPATLSRGARVRVPFGRRRLVGVLIELASRSELPSAKLKAALEILDFEPVLDEELLGFLSWAADYYHHPVGEVLAAALPVALRDGAAATEINEHWRLTRAGEEEALAILGRRAPRQRALIERLGAGAASAVQLEGLGPRWRETLRNLAARGWVESIDVPAQVVQRPVFSVAPGPVLTDAQAGVLHTLTHAGTRFAAWLLHGVTGSGK